MVDYSKMRKSKNVDNRTDPRTRAQDMREIARQIAATTSAVSLAPYPRAKLKEARQLNRLAMRLDASARKKK